VLALALVAATAIARALLWASLANSTLSTTSVERS
jgi:hypothetical protein